jgi:hypothetical protein
MSLDQTDQIAREAARLIQVGRGMDVHAAIHEAAASLGLQGARLPSVERVRKHAQAMAMQAMGEEDYEAKRRQMWETAEQLMAALEFALPDSSTKLVGRAAEGHLDAGVAVHIRLRSNEAVPAIVDQLTLLGYEKVSFRTAETRHGRLTQIVLMDDGFEIVLTRCPNRDEFDDELALFSGKSVKSSTLDQLQRSIREHNQRLS